MLKKVSKLLSKQDNQKNDANDVNDPSLENRNLESKVADLDAIVVKRSAEGLITKPKEQAVRRSYYE
jgi:hypothetical protein